MYDIGQDRTGQDRTGQDMCMILDRTGHVYDIGQDMYMCTILDRTGHV
jgi:hypothetical protein